jgi:hypothetical protein
MAKSEKTTDELWIENVKKYFPTFKEIYDSEKEMLDFGLGFQRIYETFEKAFSELFSLSEFYLVFKTVENDFLKLVMMSSIIEKLSSKKDYITFSQWLSQTKRNDIENNTNLLLNEYNKTYGCSGKFRSYFQNYLSEKEQIELLTTIQVFESVNGKDELVPLFCYDKNACSDKVNLCNRGYVFVNCTALNKKKIAREGIKEFSDFLYSLRNKFVHDAHVFYFSEKASEEPIPFFTYIPYEFKHIKKPSYSGMVVLKLTVADLEKKLNRDFKKLLTNYIKMRCNMQILRLIAINISFC